MSDIAHAAGITRMSLYRYFSDRDMIAFEIAVRMLRLVTDQTDTSEHDLSLKAIRSQITRMIDQFYPLRDAFRYLGMFDYLYGVTYPNEQLAAWYKQQIFGLGWSHLIEQNGTDAITSSQLAMVANATMSFLQKLAIRGELLSAEQEVSLDEELAHYKSMINTYFDSLAASK